jgi:hypothetical protein
MEVKCETFGSSTKSWDALVAEAGRFATDVGKDRLISISVSEGGGTDLLGYGSRGMIFVWYWG